MTITAMNAEAQTTMAVSRRRMRALQSTMSKLVPAAALALILAIAPGASASCGSSSCPLDLHALGLADNAKLVADLSFQYIHQDLLLHGSSRARSAEVPAEHDEVATMNRLTSLQLRYRATPELQLIANLPFVSRSHDHVAAASGTLEQWNFGAAGDASLQARYRAYVSDNPTHDSFWIGAAVKFATGSTSEKSAGGEEAEVPLQPGSGSTDVTIGASYEAAFVRDTALEGFLGNATAIPWFVSATYRRNGRGTHDYRRGDEVQVAGGSEYPLSKSLHLAVQINVRHTAQDETGTTGEDPGLTGGTWLYLSPGLRWQLPRGASVYGFVQLPVYQYVNGVQLASRVNFMAGIQQRF